MNDRPIHHVCYIVDDIPKAVDQWVETTGAGPFFHLGQHASSKRRCWRESPACSTTPRRSASGARSSSS